MAGANNVPVGAKVAVIVYVPGEDVLVICAEYCPLELVVAVAEAPQLPFIETVWLPKATQLPDAF